MACDAKLNFDDNAEWRQAEIFKFRDYTQEDTREVWCTSVRLEMVSFLPVSCDAVCGRLRRYA